MGFFLKQFLVVMKLIFLSVLLFISTSMPVFGATPLAGINSQSSYLQYYGNDFSLANLKRLSQYKVVVLDPNLSNITPSAVAYLQNNGVKYVLGYISIGEEASNVPMVRGAINTPSGAGPFYHNGTAVVGEAKGVASYYVDQEWTPASNNYVTDGAADINRNFGGRFVYPNAFWRQTINAQRRGGSVTMPNRTALCGLAQIVGMRISDLDVNPNNNFGFDGFFLDTIDTAGPFENVWGYYAWTAAEMQKTVQFIRQTYPVSTIMANRGVFFYNHKLINNRFGVHPYDFNIRPYINALLFESATLDSLKLQSLSAYFDDNRYSFIPKVMAEANRPDGFTVFVLDYAMGRPKPLLDFAYGRAVQKLGWTEYIADDGGIATVGQYTLPVNGYPADISPPNWDSINATSVYPAVDVPDRIGIQEVVSDANAGTATVYWDVASDQSLPIKYNIYVSQNPIFPLANTSVYRNVAFQNGHALTTDPTDEYANKFTISGLVAGVTYYFRVRAEDALAQEDSNLVTRSVVIGIHDSKTVANPVLIPRLMSIDGNMIDWQGFRAFASDLADIPNYTGQIDILALNMADDINNFYFSLSNDAPITKLSWGYTIYLDTDMKKSTGYIGTGGNFSIGADFMLQGATLYQYNGTGKSWGWFPVMGAVISSSVVGNNVEISIDKKSLGNATNVDFFFYGDNSVTLHPNDIDLVPDDAFTAGKALHYQANAAMISGPNDILPPLLYAPADVQLTTTLPIIPVALGVASGIDQVDGLMSVVNNAPSLFQIGTTYVTYTTTDLSGNTASAVQKVIINKPPLTLDTQAPIVVSPAAITISATSLSGRAATVAPALASTFAAHDAALWQQSDGWSNGGMFQVGWRADHVSFANGNLKLKLDNQPTCATTPLACSNQAYASGEYKSLNTISHGRLTFRAKPAKGSGVVTGLFTYTGTSGTANHDEIDIEFLGKDTTGVQFNYFVAGVGGHEFWLPLGFDAALALHDYSIEWLPNAIHWYVDGVLKHTVNAGAGVTLPSRPQNIFMNLWASTGVNAWTGPFVYTAPISAEVSQVSYKPKATAAFASFLNGATATDNVGVVGDITNNVPVTLPVGTRNVTFTATDAAGNQGTATSTVTVSAYIPPDTIKPVIAVNGANPITVEAGQSYVDSLATVTDNVDATNALLAGMSTVNTVAVGSYTVTYNASDVAGNVAIPVIRTVNVVDTTNPVLTLPADAVVQSTGLRTPVVIGTAVATDLFAVTITNNAPADFPVGITSVTWTATDANGRVSTAVQQVTVNAVVIADTVKPVITLTGGNVTVAQGSIYNDTGATALDNVDGNITNKIVPTNTVNTSVLGTYSVTYNVKDVAGNPALPVTRTVTVIPALTMPRTTLSASHVNAVPRSTVLLPITITPSTAVAAFNIAVNFSINNLTLGMIDTSVLPVSWSCISTGTPPSPAGIGRLQFICSSTVVADALTASTTTINLPVTVTVPAVVGTVFPIGLAGSQLFDTVNMPIPTTLTDGSITVSRVSATYNLTAGWNLVSFPLDLGATGLNDFIAQSPTVSEVWSYNTVNGQGQWSSYIVGLPPFLNALKSVQPGVGYWVKSNAPAVVTLIGSTPLPLVVPAYQAGWSLLGVLGPVADVGAYMTTQKASEVWGYTNGGWCSNISGLPVFLNCLKTLKPEAGYFIKRP